MIDPQKHMPASVAAVGEGWLVVDKPEGISVHNDPDRDVCTGVQAMLTEDRGLADQAGFVPGTGIHAPHRLDRDTSGLVLLCCNVAALKFYGAAFREQRVGKCYLAILHGRLEASSGSGFWDFPLARSGGGRTNPTGAGKRVACRTAFQVIRHSEHYTLAACAPLTGRQHQIRRHAKLAGHPVVGDRRYGSPRSLRYLRATAGFERLGLHAYGLDLPIALSQERAVVISRALPLAFGQLLTGDSERSAAEWTADLQEPANPARWPGNCL
jgi:23S rRNA-/tRNA-specific pseudouridylate synthase